MDQSAVLLEPFCKLADVAGYEVCDWDLIEDASMRLHWTRFMRRNVVTMLQLGVDAAHRRSDRTAQGRATRCQSDFDELFDRLEQVPHEFGRLTMWKLDALRDRMMRKWGFDDPYIDLKHRENEQALPLLPGVCAMLDGLTLSESFLTAVKGVFAGNIFDMGAEATATAFLEQSPDFSMVRGGLAPRPWLVDDYDAWADRVLHGGGYKKVVLFADNAGSDFILGVVPLTRWLCRQGVQVVVAGNDLAALNDMTYEDMVQWWPKIMQVEPSLRDLPISFVNTGTGEPLIDLSQVSPELNSASADADLVILEGMGRGVESNLNVELMCDVVNLAMLKDVAVATRYGGKLYDIVCRFRRGVSGSSR